MSATRSRTVIRSLAELADLATALVLQLEEQFALDKSGNVHIVWAVDAFLTSNTCAYRQLATRLEEK
jgi:hypothetical protein